MSAGNILLVEDQVDFIDFLLKILAEKYAVTVAQTDTCARKQLAENTFDLVLLDLNYPKAEGDGPEPLGFDLLTDLRQQQPFLEIIVLTATYIEKKDHQLAIKKGAFSFVVKDDYHTVLNKLDLEIGHALERRRSRMNSEASQRRNEMLAQLQSRVHKYRPRDLEPCYRYGVFLGESEAMQRVYTFIERMAASRNEQPVLIYGGSGTGKELLARCLHNVSPRAGIPLVPVNMAALSESVLESELFGHEKGAFTDARERKIGYFEAAKGSTLFMDEIAEIPSSIQIKLLRVLQDKIIQRVGATNPIPVDIRFIAATNKNLNEQVKKGVFREDLMFRLDVLSFTMPALRERLEDIPNLCRHILYEEQMEEKSGELMLSDEAVEKLMRYSWPGNVRQLQNVLKKAVIMRENNVIEASDIRDEWMPEPERPLSVAAGNPLTSGDHAEPEVTVLPSLETILNGGSKTDLKEIKDPELQARFFLGLLIAAEGHFDNVLPQIGIARATASKIQERALELLLTDLARCGADVARLAESWQVDTEQLHQTIGRANRPRKTFNKLFKNYGNDPERLANHLAVTPEQLNLLKTYLQK